MPLHEAVVPSIPSRPDVGRSSRRTAQLPPLLASIAVGAFAITDEQFDEALAELRRELAPSSVLESLLVALVVEAAERLRVASRQRDKIEAGDPKWTRYRNQAERSFWKALKALNDGRRPVRTSKPAGSWATAEASQPEGAGAIPAGSDKRPAAQPVATPPPPKPALPAEPRPEPTSRPDREPVLPAKPPAVLENLLAALAAPTGSSFVDLAATPAANRPARDGRPRPQLQPA